MPVAPEAPNPNGERPDEWKPADWEIYTRWATGTATQPEIADELGISLYQVKKLARHVRENYSTGSLSYNKPGLTPEARQLGTQASSEARHLQLMSRRLGLAEQITDKIEATVALLDTWAVAYSKRAGWMTPKDFQALTAGIRNLAAVSDRLSVDPTDAGKADPGGTQITTNVVVLPDTVNGALARIDNLMPAEPIEVDLASNE